MPLRVMFAALIATTSMAATAARESPDKWRILAGRSEMDDSKRLVFRLDAENEIDDWLRRRHRPALIVRCEERHLAAYIITGMGAQPELGHFEQFTVRVRFDDGKPATALWLESTDNEALFPKAPASFMARIAEASSLKFEFTPFHANHTVATFDVRGFAPHLAELKKTCRR